MTSKTYELTETKKSKSHRSEGVLLGLLPQNTPRHRTFRLMQVFGDWLVYDVVIDGASIVSNYRAQFMSIIRDVAYVGLVKKMKQNAVSVKVFERSPTP